MKSNKNKTIYNIATFLALQKDINLITGGIALYLANFITQSKKNGLMLQEWQIGLLLKMFNAVDSTLCSNELQIQKQKKEGLIYFNENYEKTLEAIRENYEWKEEN